MSKTAFLFPGQGAQTIGMGKATCDEIPAAKAIFEQANELLGYDLAKICFEGPTDVLNSTVHCQPGLFVCSMAALERVRSEQPELLERVDMTAGLSLGEYTALVFAGAMSFESALKLVQVRGEAMQAAADAVDSGMVSVLGMDLEQVEALCDSSRRTGEVLQVANHLCPGNLVCSGHQASCDELAKQADAAGAMKVIPLAVAGAFHTPLMEPALERLKQALAQAEISAPRLPVISNVDTASHSDPDDIRAILLQQVVRPVLWEAGVRKMLNDGVSEFYEVGTGKVLRGLLRRTDRKQKCTNIE